MFRLLTEETRAKVLGEYGKRRAVVLLLAVSIVLVIGIVGLFPSYLLSNNRENEAFERVRIIENSEQVESKEDLQAWLTKINLKLQVLAPKLDIDRPSEFIENVLNEKISGIIIIGFSWTKIDDKVALSVEGVAINRQALVDFDKKIKESKHFSEVTLPVSNLAQDKNINFQIKFSL